MHVWGLLLLFCNAFSLSLLLLFVTVVGHVVIMALGSCFRYIMFSFAGVFSSSLQPSILAVVLRMS